ncbi:MAG: histidine ammonia-lyase [Armatimonadetes bacterium]|nr:histidine ammonia-lyase [Armatimonadota bacterium]
MIELGKPEISLQELAEIAHRRATVSIAPEVRPRVDAGRQVIDDILSTDAVVYGVNTGFGRLADRRISETQLAELQLNLVRSHAVGVGQPLSIAETRAMMVLRAQVLSLGYSGARYELLDLLIEMINRGVHPIVPSRGSVGASGDLAPLAHLALALIGEGQCWSDSGPIPSADALAAAGLTPAVLLAKEGLALLNGTQAIGAVGGLALHRALRCAHIADVAGAMTLEALTDTPAAFDPRISEVRKHAGQIQAALHLREILFDSEIRESHREHDTRVQDAYSIRCMPQVHGAVRTALDHVRSILRAETGAATDNPLVFATENEVISGGNFHAAPLAYALDYAAIVLTDLMSISERRIDRLVNPDSSEGLPAFLSRDPGVSSGFMMAHVTVAALLSEAKVLAHPSSVDSVPTSGGKEDHVSMGMTSALKLRSIVDLLEHVLAIELLAGWTGLEFRRPLRGGRGVETARAVLEEHIAPVTQDRSLSADIEAVASIIRSGALDSGLEHWE